MLTSFKRAILILLACTLIMAQSQDTTALDSSNLKDPGKALMMSLIPGGGQLYNERPLKAILFAGVFTYYAYEYSQAQKIYQTAPLDQTLHRSRNDKIWLMALTWTLNIIDAYVDSELWDFEKYDIDEEVLPETEILKPKEMGN